MSTERALWEASLDPGGSEGALRGWGAAKIELDTGLVLKELTISLGKDIEKHIRRQKDTIVRRSFISKQGSLHGGSGI